MDGDLGKYDALDIRLSVADTILVLDFSLFCCLKRAIKRSRERFDFWWWLITWQWLSRPKIMQSIKTYASKADVRIFHTPNELKQFITSIER
jgi:hypothetical protein